MTPGGKRLLVIGRGGEERTAGFGSQIEVPQLTIILVISRIAPMAKTLPISEVKARLPELVTGVAEREEEIVVTKNGRPAAMLVNYDEYRRQRDTLDILSDPEMMKQIRQSRRFYEKSVKGLSFKDVFGEPQVPAKKRAR